MSVAVTAVVYTITPATMAVAGGSATITGASGLAGTTGINFGPLAAPAFSVYDDTLVYVTAPAHNTGTVPVTVHTARGDLVVAGGLTYTAPAVAVDWPKLPEVRTLLRLQPNATEDTVIDTARLSGIDYCNRRTNYRWPPGSTANWVQPMPDSLHQAALFQAAHEYRRRDSLDGAIGWGDQGVFRVPRTDPDVERILYSLGPVVFG